MNICMNQFIYKIFLIAFFCFIVQNITAEKAVQDNKILYSNTENQYISCSSDFFNHSANKENRHYSFQRLFPNPQKFSVNSELSDTKTEVLNSASINRCIAKSKNQIIKFDGVDIIHPFNYFW